MGLTFKIDDVPYDEIQNGQGKYALKFSPGSPKHDNVYTHVKGVIGEYRVEGEFQNQMIHVKMQYVQPLETIYTEWANDLGSWEGTEISIYDPNNQEYKRCILVEDSGKIERDPEATGVDDNVFMEVEAVFRSMQGLN